jgi:hypothetical protein
MTHSICCIQCIGPSHPLPRLGTFHVTERGAGEPEPENDDGVKKLPHAFGDGRRHSHCPPALRTLFPSFLPQSRLFNHGCAMASRRAAAPPPCPPPLSDPRSRSCHLL